MLNPFLLKSHDAILCESIDEANSLIAKLRNLGFYWDPCLKGSITNILEDLYRWSKDNRFLKISKGTPLFIFTHLDDPEPSKLLTCHIASSKHSKCIYYKDLIQ